MRVVISGTSGFVGSHLVHHLRERDNVLLIALDRFAYEPTHSAVSEVLLTGESFDCSCLRATQFDAIVHCAGMTSFAKCEELPGEAFHANVRVTETLLGLAQERGAYFCFLSSDLVFDGNENPPKNGFDETVEPVALSVYSKTKREAEVLVRDAQISAGVLRASLVYGEAAGRSGGPLQWIRNTVQNEGSIRAFYDEFRTPLDVTDLVHAIEKFLQRRLEGVFHCSGDEKVVRTDFVRMCLEALGVPQMEMESCSRREIPGPRRPEDVSLNNSKITETLNFCFTPLEEGLARSFRGEIKW